MCEEFHLPICIGKVHLFSTTVLLRDQSNTKEILQCKFIMTNVIRDCINKFESSLSAVLRN